MDTFFLLKELAEEIRNITKNMYFKNYKGKPIELQVFEQDLPYQDADEVEEPFPYVIVRAANGTVSQDVEKNRVKVMLIIGIKERDAKNDGQKQILGIIQRIVERFSKDNSLPYCMQVGDMEWALDDEAMYPYYFGGMTMTFQMFKIGRETGAWQ